ncbi:MAG: hypothetical protein J6A19_03410 [Oscillospiraceae bacterium]|nr:hypothetical protein [Oscillospiraceae bacterium]
MDYEKKFDVNYDYEAVLLLTDSTETLVGGSTKIIKKVLKNSGSPNLSVKDLDIYLREQPLGTFAIDIFRSLSDIEELQEHSDRLYTNLCNKNTNKQRIAETLNSLDHIFVIDKSITLRLLARTISKWYNTATHLYMNARHGMPLKQTDRALLGEQFRDDVETLITDTFTTLKKKKSPQDTEICEVIRCNCSEISELLTEYSRYLTCRKVFCVQCKLCVSFFLAKSKNTQYCEECKVLRKKNSKAIYREKCSEGVFSFRQQVKYRFENFIHKNKAWERLSDADKAEYKALHDEFIRTSAAMLREFEKNGGEELEKEIEDYIGSINSRRAELEGRARA